MKEFEKWFNKKYPLPPTIERGPVGRDFKRGCGETWKAALEWAESEANDIGYYGEAVSVDKIRKELNNE